MIIELKTPWSGHWREGEFLGFMQWSLSEKRIRDQYFEDTGDDFAPSIDKTTLEQQVSSGEVLAFFERYAVWLAEHVFGTPGGPIDSQGQIVVGRTLH